MKSTSAVRVLDADNYLGESPVWSVEEQAFYWVNCEQPPELHRWKYATDVHDKWPLPRRVGGVALREGGFVVLALADGIYNFDTKTGKCTLRVASPLPEHVKLHECQCDRQGRLWVGSYDHHFTPTTRDAKGGSLFRMDGDRLTDVIQGISVSNGLAFSPDGRVMYHSDSPTRLIESYALDPDSGELSPPRPFSQLAAGEGFPDGAVIDAEGGYWLAAFSVGALRRYHANGILDRVVELPFSNPTKAAFGGPELNMLFVTSTKLKVGSTPGQGNGGLYALVPGERGLPEPIVKD